jgi:hypothetical protein
MNEWPTNSASSAVPSKIKFKNNTNNAFAYELGLGLQHDIYNDRIHNVLFSASLDYRYVNFGEGKFGATPAGDRMEVEHLSTQAIMLTINARVFALTD